MKKCENCQKEHEGIYGSGRFCSSKCARGFSSKEKRFIINETVSKKLSQYQKINRICPICLNEFITNEKKNQICCSVSCATILKGGWNYSHNKLSSEDWSKIHKKSYANGERIIAGGLTKWFDYNGIRVQGTYELRTCQILDIWKSYNIIKDWEYTKDRVEYIGEDGKNHNYLLDFKVFTNEGFFYYIEVKGYEHSNDPLKWKAVRDKGYKLEVWFKKDIIEIENKL